MITNALKPIDVQDFQFKLHCRLKIFDKLLETPQLSQSCNLLACASRFGLIFAGTNSANFQAIRLRDLEQYEKADGDKADYPRRIVSLPSPPKYLSTNCEHTILAVIIEKDTCPWAIFYDVKSFFSINLLQLGEVRLSSTPGVNVVDVSWNPALAAIFTACKSDGSLGNYEIKNPGIDINELPAQAGATCFCWSPKGKQIAVGSRDGRITQYKPDLKAVKVINSPPMKEINSLVSLQWVSNYQFIGIFQPCSSPDNPASLIVIDAPKAGEPVYVNYEDVCYSNGSLRLSQFYMILIHNWNILMVASSNSMEVGVLGSVGEKWTQWTLEDAARAELPLSSDDQDTLPVGFALDIGSTTPLSWGEGSLPPTPYLLLLSHHGTLCCFNVVNLKENIPSVCSPAENLADSSGLKSFIIPTVQKQPESPQVEATTKPLPIIPQTQTSQTQSSSLFGAGTAPLPPPPSSNLFGFNAKEKSAATITPISSGLGLFPQQQQQQQQQQTIPAVTQISTTKSANIEPTNSKQIPPVSAPAAELTVSKFVEDKPAEEEEEALLAQLIKEECIFLESELKAVLHQKYKISIGSDSDKSALVSKTLQLTDFFKQVVENCSTQNAEVHCLCQNVMQSWAWYEEAKSRYKAFDDESINLVLRSQPLDLPSEKQLGDIQHASYYLESQMAQAHRALDEQWDNFQDYCKKTQKIQMPTMEAIFQTMVKQYGILQKQSYIMKDITRRIKNEARSSLGPSLLVSVSDKTELDHELKMLRLEPEDIRQIQHVHVLNRTKNFTGKKQDNLRVFWKTQKYKQISVSKSQLSTSVLQSSTIMKPPTNKQFSILGAKMSPVSKDASISRKIDFLQSTPKPTPKEFFTKTNTPIEGLQNFAMKFENSNFKNVASVKNVTTIASSPNSAFVSTSLGSFSATPPPPPPSSSSTTTTTFSSKSLTSLTKPVSVFTNSGILPTAKSTTSTLFAQNQPVISISAANASKPFNFSSFAPCTTSEGVLKPSSSSSSIFSTSTPTPTSVKPFSFSVASSPSIFGVSEDKTSTTKQEIVYSTPPPSSILNLTTSTKPSSTAVSSVSSSGSLFASTLSLSAPPPSKPFSFASLAGNSAISITPLPKPSAKVTSTPLNLSQPLNLVSESGSTAQVVVSSSGIEITSKAPVILSVPSSETVQAAVKPSIFGAIVSSTGTIFANPPSSVAISTTSEKSTTSSSSIFSSIQPSSSTTSQFGAVTSTSSTSSGIFSSQAPSIFGGATTSAPSVFGASSSVFKSSTVASTAAESSVFGAVAKTTTQSSIFGGSSTVSTAPLFGSVSTSSATATVASSPSIFGNNSSASVVASSQPLFGTLAAAATTKPSIFGSFTPTSTTQTSSVFGAAPLAAAAATTTTTTSQTPIFGGTSSVFGATSTSAPQSFASFTGSTQQKPASSIFGNQSSSSPSIFGASATVTTTAQSSLFGKTSSVFASNTTASSSAFGSSGAFGTPATADSSSTTFGQTQPVFGGAGGADAFGSHSFGGGTTASVFGSSSSSFGQTSASVFGTPTTTTSAGIFGASAATTSSSVFGAFGGASTQSSGFGATNAGSFGFGGLNVGAAATTESGGFAANPFGTPTAQKTAFGADTNSNKSIFGGAGGGAAASSGSLFGTASSSSSSSSANANNVFGGGNNQASFGGGASSAAGGQQSIFGKSAFGQSSGFGGFGGQQLQQQQPQPSSGGPFSASAGSVSQSGFGASPSFQKPAAVSPSAAGFGAGPVFGSSSSFGSAPSFGGAPAFGTSSAFGSPQKVFGSAGNAGSSGFGSSPIIPSNNTQNTVFSNLANQPTVGFGNLAQQASTPPPQASNNSFSGGSSFSSWR